MIRIDSEDELRRAFRAVDQLDLTIPSSLKFPISLKDYIAWSEPSNPRVFLLFQDPNGSGALGVVFRRSHAEPGSPVQMCQWCHSVRGKGAVTLLTATVNSKRRIGLYLCRDLDCKDKVLAPPGINDLREPYSAYEKLFRVLMNMSEFFQRSLLLLPPSTDRDSARH